MAINSSLHSLLGQQNRLLVEDDQFTILFDVSTHTIHCIPGIVHLPQWTIIVLHIEVILEVKTCYKNSDMELKS